MTVPSKWKRYWDKPWLDEAKRSPGFRRFLADHKLLTPNYSYADAACHDGTQIPAWMRYQARNHAFQLEKFAHEIGHKGGLPIISWYRTKAYNTQIGGASQSYHIKGVATDFSREFVSSVGMTKWVSAQEKWFKNGGAGAYPTGSRHLDSRGFRARWTTF